MSDFVPGTEGTITMDPVDFTAFIRVRKQFYNSLGSYPSVIILPDELEDLIVHHFFAGKLSDLVTYNTDRHGKIRMYLAGVKTMFSDKVALGNSLWVLDAHEVQLPDGTVTPTTGPGAPLGGGTPIAAAIAA